MHLVMPERSPFRETQTTSTASVVVDMKSGARLSAEHIAGVIALVSGAVEGLEPTDVNILDTNGNMLSDPDAKNSDGRLSSNQMRMQTEKEAYLQEKAQSLLDQMLGDGNSILRVNLELDFSRSVLESSMIDPKARRSLRKNGYKKKVISIMPALPFATMKSAGPSKPLKNL